MSGDGIKGGVLDLDVPQPLPFMRPSQTMTQKQETNPTFKPQGKIFKSKNALLNNLTTDDIRDLKKLFSEIGEEEIKKKETTAKIRKATVKRIKTDAKKPKKSPLAKIRGTIEGKRQALKKYKKKST
jgi:hypothetical protein